MNEKECVTCHKVKPLTEFNVRNNGGQSGKNLTYRNQCKECRRKCWNNWDSSHKEQRKIEHHNSYIKAKNNGTLKTFKQQCREKKKKYVEMLGGKCQNPNCACPNGYNRNLSALDFHHINPEDRSKNRESTEYIYKFFEKLVLDGKIRLLCANCHRELHYGEN